MRQFDFDALLEAMPDAVVVADMESRIVYVNSAVERMLGWRRDELVGQSLHVMQPERLHVAHDAGFGRYARTGIPRLFGAPIRVPAQRADGSEVEIELNLAEIRQDGERLAVGVLRGLGERVDLERHVAILRYLKATTAAHTRLWAHLDPTVVLQTLTDALVDDFDAALARTWIHDPETNTLRLRTSGGLSTRVAGSSREVIDVETHPYKIGVVARTRTPFIRNGLEADPAFEQEWIEREGIQSVIVLPLLAGEQLLGVMVSFFRHPIFDEVAETIGHLAALTAATLNDARLVAQEREARQAADRARRHFELLARVSERLAGTLNPEVTVQNVADAVVPDFADWCVVDLLSDNGALQMVASAHRAPEKVERIRELRTRYPPAERKTSRHVIYRAIESGTTLLESVTDAELAVRAVNEDHLSLLRELGIGSHIVVPLTARGRVVGTMSLIRAPGREPFDDDDRLTAEDLGRRTALATDNARLYRSAQEAIALRDRFLAVASHELRTPLSVVRGNWELLGRRLRSPAADPDAQRESIESSVRRLGHGIEQLQRLVEDLLGVNRVRAGSVDLQRTELDLVTLIRDTVEDVHDLDARSRVRLRLPATPVVGSWDRARLAQVVGNLLGNALKYSPPDAPVEVALTRLAHDVRITVTDSGIGIAVEQLDDIFEPFSRAPNASARHYPGLGLGLAVSSEIVLQLGGRIWAESAGEGRGSSFFVELPIHPPEEASVAVRP